MKINFIYQKKISFSKEEKNHFKETVSLISLKEKIIFGNINIIFCSDEYIKEYNNKFLGHDYETDIITFHDTDENGNTEGELLISADTVKYNSGIYKTEFINEMLRVIIHGILHLSGYKDKTDLQKKLMKKKENYYLKSIN